MNYPKLNELMDYVFGDSIPQRWYGAIDLVYSEREQITSRLQEDPSLSAYGFTSMLGPNDYKDMQSHQQEMMLRAHCLGTPSEISTLEKKSIAASKIIQLANGGTGISDCRYRELLDIARTYNFGEVKIDLDASYGSGDVVPAAWWVCSLWGSETNWNPGDLISLINGDYISSAYSFLAFTRLLECISKFINLTSGIYNQYVPGCPANLLDEFLNQVYSERDLWDSPPQLPVSQRDVFPILHSMTSGIYLFAETLETAYSSHSGNPIFINSNNGIFAKSQSSFINLELSNTLHGINSLVSQMSSLTQRAVEVVSKIDSEDSSMDDFNVSKLSGVQFPKVSEAYRIKISCPLALNYSGSMSGGVEDLWDLNLINSRTILYKFNLLDKQLDVLAKSLNVSREDCSDKISAADIWEFISAR